METTKLEAEQAASRMANMSGLPQTVYRNENSGGWWHINSLAPILGRADVYITVLPINFFR